MKNLPVKTALAVLTCMGTLVVANRISGSKGLDNSAGGDFVRSMTKFDVDTTPPLPVMPVRHEEEFVPANGLVRSALLQDGSGVLDRFYQALWEAEKGTGQVRVLHYGDSPTTADLITGDVREILQRRFGNAGHGFLFVDKPWAWYQHYGVDISGSGWHVDTAVETMKENDYGLGGAVFQGSAGASTKIQLRDHTYAAVEVEYQPSPEAGDIEVLANGRHVAYVHTAGTEPAGFEKVDLPDHAEKLELKVASGTVRVFGVSLERNAPGLVYESLGLNGASTVVMSRVFSEKRWGEELRHRHPDLIIINYGTNESGFASFVEKQYEKELVLAIQKIRKALPETPILVMSPMDRGKREGAMIKTMPTIPRVIEIQQKVAKKYGCGFFNTFQAMGGESTMARWYEKQPRMVAADLIHPSPKGSRLVAEAFFRQLMAGYAGYKLRHQTPVQMAGTRPKASAKRVQ